MKYTAHINIMPLKELLDPQGKAVNNSLHNLGINQVHDVRIGKFTKRRFRKETKFVIVITANDVKDIYNINEAKTVIANNRFIAYYSYASIMSNFINKVSVSNITLQQKLGPFSAVFNTHQY